jgi:hypothetical protein
MFVVYFLLLLETGGVPQELRVTNSNLASKATINTYATQLVTLNNLVMYYMDFHLHSCLEPHKY